MTNEENLYSKTLEQIVHLLYLFSYVYSQYLTFFFN